MVRRGIYDQVQFLRNKLYSGITNIDGGVALGSNYKVEIIDFNQNILSDISENFYLSEFTDNDTGKIQFNWEFCFIDLQFFKKNVFFKITHLLSDLVLYSNPVIFGNYQEFETVTFNFRNYQNLDGTNYEVSPIFQSITLKGYFYKKADKSLYQLFKLIRLLIKP